ncbi:MAG: polymer-forming cytoskeletal protein [Pseudomonadota bacterium]
MFSKAKRDKSDERQLPEFEEQSLVTQDQQLSRRADARSSAKTKAPRTASAGVPSLISADMTIRGEVHAEGEVQFDGQIDGDIHAKGLVIGEGAEVRGEVIADKVKVAGAVDGVIRATRVELTATSVVRGEVLHTALMIEAGARFEGNCRHSDDPVNDKSSSSSAPVARDLAPAPVAPPRQAQPAPIQQEAKQAADAQPIRRDNAAEPADKAEAAAKLPPLRQNGKGLSGKVNLR